MACSYRAEGVALFGLLTSLLEHCELEQRRQGLARVIVFTDSQGLLQALQRGPVACRGGAEHTLWEGLRLLSRKGVAIVLAFVFSHVGFPPNEAADALASDLLKSSKALRESLWFYDHQFGETESWLRDECRALCRGFTPWNSILQTGNPDNEWHVGKSRMAIPLLTISDTRCRPLSHAALKEVPEDCQRLLLQFRTHRPPGVGRLHGGADDPDCPECGETDSVEHFFACERHPRLSKYTVSDLFKDDQLPCLARALKDTWLPRWTQRGTQE